MLYSFICLSFKDYANIIKKIVIIISITIRENATGIKPKRKNLV